MRLILCIAMLFIIWYVASSPDQMMQCRNDAVLLGYNPDLCNVLARPSVLGKL